MEAACEKQVASDEFCSFAPLLCTQLCREYLLIISSILGTVMDTGASVEGKTRIICVSKTGVLVLETDTNVHSIKELLSMKSAKKINKVLWWRVSSHRTVKEAPPETGA